MQRTAKQLRFLWNLDGRDIIHTAFVMRPSPEAGVGRTISVAVLAVSDSTSQRSIPVRLKDLAR